MFAHPNQALDQPLLIANVFATTEKRIIRLYTCIATFNCITTIQMIPGLLPTYSRRVASLTKAVPHLKLRSVGLDTTEMHCIEIVRILLNIAKDENSRGFITVTYQRRP